jgi:anti-anti-sigma factor
METEISAGDGVTTLRVSGAVDLATADELRETGTDALRPDRVVRIDLAGVDFIDSSGLAALIGIRNAAAERDCRLTLTAMSSAVGRILTITGLDLFFDVEP